MRCTSNGRMELLYSLYCRGGRRDGGRDWVTWQISREISFKTEVKFLEYILIKDQQFLLQMNTHAYTFQLSN